MRKNNKGNLLEGLVVDNDDPQQMGRLKIWVPALDGDSYEIENLPWAFYLSPLAGQTLDFEAGETSSKTEGFVSYGFWAIPKNGAMVVVGLLHNDVNLRFYMGSMFREHGNRSLPQGRNRPDITPGPLSDTYEQIHPHIDNLKLQFQNKLTESEAKTRGVEERMVAQDQTIKDGKEGYQTSSSGEGKLEPQTYCFVSPGHHALVFQDHPTSSRVRLKTASGHQIILDDANERIYISTARGNNYVELDADGRIHVYSNNDLSMNIGGSVNWEIGKDLNINAENVNIQGRKDVKVSSCEEMHLRSTKKMFLTTEEDLNMKIKDKLVITSSVLFINSGLKAKEAKCCDLPTNIPQHEPWKRPASKVKRNKNWKA